MSHSSLAPFNVARARLVIDTLYQKGVSHFCIAPGSRSTPLTLAVAENPLLNAHVHFDERGLGFYALGLAKSSGSPVAIIVTTGTAVANLLPAIVEAHLSYVPLLILSADRPPELRDCGANQTADHVKLFTAFTRWEVDLAFSDPLSFDNSIASSIAHAVSRSSQSPAGPVHINCMIREPFIHLDPVESLSYAHSEYEPVDFVPPSSSFELWGSLLSKKEKGVILLGSDAVKPEDIPSLLTLAETLGWPIISDIISGGRQIGDHPYHIEHSELLLRSLPDLKADAILHIGNRLVSKFIQNWAYSQEEGSYFLVTNHPFRQDPAHKVSRRMTCKTSTFCSSLLKWISSPKEPWALTWKKASRHTAKILDTHFENLSEPALFSFLSKQTPSAPFFFSNSMPIRDADLLFYPPEGSLMTFCNRGASGIDGNIATALGMASGLQKSIIAILGDLAALHDMSSFALLSENTPPVIFIVINNGGGGIFSFLPVAKKTEAFEKFVATSHQYCFASIANTFSLPYTKVTSWEQWKDAWNEASKNNTSCMIECCTNRQVNVTDHEEIYDIVGKHLCSFMKPMETLV